jgi:hypothetical protein
MQATDPQSSFSLKRSYIMLYWPAGSADLPMHGDAQRLASVAGNERIVRLTNTNGRVLDRAQLQVVADLIATLENGCTGGHNGAIASSSSFIAPHGLECPLRILATLPASSGASAESQTETVC